MIPMSVSHSVWRTTNARDLTKSAMRTTTTVSSVAETVEQMTAAARVVTTVISTVPIPLPSVTGQLTSVAAGTTTIAMSETSVTLIPMSVSLSVWRIRNVWASTRSAMSSTTTASTVELETAKHLSAVVQDAMTVILTASIPRRSVWEITLVDVSQTQTATLAISVTRTQMLARKSPTSARLMRTVMRDSLEFVPLMLMVRLLSANIVSPMVSTTSANQAASITRTLMRFPDVQSVLTIAMSIPTTAKPLQGQPY